VAAAAATGRPPKRRRLDGHLRSRPDFFPSPNNFPPPICVNLYIGLSAAIAVQNIGSQTLIFIAFARHSDFFLSLNSSTEQIANSSNKFTSVIIVLTLFFEALAFLIPGIYLDPEDISSACPN